MEFGLSEENRLLQDSVRKVLESHCSLEEVRRLVKSHEPWSSGLWKELCGMGAVSLVIDEAYGGLGLSLLDAALVQEMLGQAVAPVPYTSSAVMAPVALARAAGEKQKNDWLPQMASGKMTMGVALSGQTGGRENSGIVCEGGLLSGKSMFALDGGVASHILVADEDDVLYVVEVNTPGIVVTLLPSIDQTRTLYEIVFDKVEAERLAGTQHRKAVTAMIRAGRVMLAADTLGASQYMLHKAVSYAGERKQFNRVIGSFQAVKHMCAEMAAELEMSRSLLWYAAYAFDAVPEEAELVSLHAKALLSDVGQFVARTATEVHGGIGTTDLLGLHYWFKRIGFNRQVLGGPERLRAQAASLQGWSRTS